MNVIALLEYFIVSTFAIIVVIYNKIYIYTMYKIILAWYKLCMLVFAHDGNSRLTLSDINMANNCSSSPY